MTTIALIEKGKDGIFGIHTPDFKHVIVGDGETVDEAKKDFENSLNEMRLSYTERGSEIPQELQNIEFDFKFDIASLFEYYSWIKVSQFAKFIGMNATLLRQYKQGGTYISDNQLSKIETGLHKIGNEIANVKLI